MFFKDSLNTFWPLSRIENISAESERPKSRFVDRFHCVELTDGNVVEIDWVEAQRILRETGKFLPAEPMTFVIHLDFSSVDPTIKSPVIGWCISPEEGVLPVTVDGINDGVEGTLPVLMPGGQVVQYQASYETLEDYIESEKPKDVSVNG